MFRLLPVFEILKLDQVQLELVDLWLHRGELFILVDSGVLQVGEAEFLHDAAVALLANAAALQVAFVVDLGLQEHSLFVVAVLAALVAAEFAFDWLVFGYGEGLVAGLALRVLEILRCGLGQFENRVVVDDPILLIPDPEKLDESLVNERLFIEPVYLLECLVQLFEQGVLVLNHLIPWLININLCI